MKNVVENITERVTGLAFWSEDWNTYRNYYIIKGNEGYILIDTGDKDNKEELIKSLEDQNIRIGEIHTVILTHGHKDHSGNVSLFENADIYVHSKDKDLIEECENLEFLYDTNGLLHGLEWKLTGGHTAGSISIYDRESKILFIGDMICFFGVPLPEEGLVSAAEDIRFMWMELVASGGLSQMLNSQNIDVEDYIAALKTLAEYNIKYLCTGHGVVLKEDIPYFLSNTANKIESLE
jgi:glyoxylase-like metal-dependent hydrolase (beta-lactamase superfamily II)